jgi:hypothetical protein
MSKREFSPAQRLERAAKFGPGGNHRGFSEHFRVRCAAFPTSTKKQLGQFLSMAGTPYARIDMYPGQASAFLHFRTWQDAESSVEKIHDGLFKGEDVMCERLGENWHIERQRAYDRALGITRDERDEEYSTV